MLGQVQTDKYDIFISYASEDQAWVDGYLLDALKRANIAYLTEAAFELGKPRILAFEQAIQQSKRTLLVLSPAYLLEGHHLFIDLLAENFGLETGAWPVLPLILKPGAPIPLRLRILNPLVAIDKEDREFAIKRLAETLQQPVPPPPPIPDPPYPGMRSYTEGESNIFFGRSREIEDLTNLLRKQQFLVLIGPSGSGKSSLMRAGLIPALHKSTDFGQGKWLIRDFRPGEDPSAALTNALDGDPTSSNMTIPALLATVPDAQRLLLFVDQFEELFTVAKAKTRDFQNTLVKLAEEPNTYVVLGARADFYPQLMTSPIWRTIQQHRYEVLPLDEKGLSEAIRQPAEQVGVYVEAALVERVVADADGEPGILPFVQETMRLLWKKVERRYLPVQAYETLLLPLSAYGGRRMEEVTGLQAAITMHAEAVFTKLEEGQQAIARRIFVRLVQFGEGRSHTRRQQPVSHLRGSIDPTQFDPILTYLANEKSRLLILGGEEKGPEREIDIAHEALIGAWPRLMEWLDNQRKTEEYRRQFVQDVEQWLRNNKDDSFCYEGVRLRELQQWVLDNPGELNAEQGVFLVLSNQQYQRRKVRQWFIRGMALLISLLVVVSIVYAAYGAYLKSIAQKMNPLVNFSAGVAWFGSDAYPDERTFPKQQVMLAAFSIDAYEVSNGQYCLCYRVGACISLSEAADNASVCTSAGKLPVMNVTAYQAAAFCRWIGRRLPTEAEWERAARGSDGRPWPWGHDRPTPAYMNMMLEGAIDTEDPRLVAVDDPAFQSGATPEGIMHLLGNVAEWTSTPATCANPYDCLTPWNGVAKVSTLYQRGYSYLSYVSISEMEGDDPAIATRSAQWSPDDRSPDLGFRCAK